MKYKTLWWVLLITGVILFAAPFIGYAYEMINSSSWTLVDWLGLLCYFSSSLFLIHFSNVHYEERKLKDLCYYKGLTFNKSCF